MRLLLDTHAFMWWDSASSQLPPSVADACQDQSNTLILSVASVWEIQIKTQLGKLNLTQPLREIISHQQQANQLRVLPVTLEHVWALQQLPLLHKDPFDRLLIAVALSENAVRASGDAAFAQYSVQPLW